VQTSVNFLTIIVNGRLKGRTLIPVESKLNEINWFFFPI
jgi:hypothetical protein